MITSVQRTAIRKLLGAKRNKKMHKFFLDNDIKSQRRGEVYAIGSIRDVFNGMVASPRVEAGIWECVRYYIQKRKEEKAEKEALLETINEVIDEPAI